MTNVYLNRIASNILVSLAKHTRKLCYLFFLFVYLNSALANTDNIYSDIEKISVYFEQGSIIMNTSMSNKNDVHYYTDSNGHDSGPTAIYSRTRTKTQKIKLDGFGIPANVHISPDNNKLYFVDFGQKEASVFFMTRTSKGWAKPVKEPNINTPGATYITTTNSGILYYSTGGDIFSFNGKNISKLSEIINSSEDEHDPFIAQDESFIIFVRQPIQSDSNMYISFHKTGKWTLPIKLPSPFNLDKIDGSPFVSSDKKYLFFSSNRNTKDDERVLKTYQVPFKALHDKLKQEAKYN